MSILPETLMHELARDNVELYRQVQELEARDRERLTRIAGLKLDLERAKQKPT